MSISLAPRNVVYFTEHPESGCAITESGKHRFYMKNRGPAENGGAALILPTEMKIKNYGLEQVTVSIGLGIRIVTKEQDPEGGRCIPCWKNTNPNWKDTCDDWACYLEFDSFRTLMLTDWLKFNKSPYGTKATQGGCPRYENTYYAGIEEEQA